MFNVLLSRINKLKEQSWQKEYREEMEVVEGIEEIEVGEDVRQRGNQDGDNHMSPDETTRVFTALSEIKGLLLGTYENPGGMAAKVDNHETWIKKQIRSREGFLNYAYKVTIMLVLSYIAIKLGLK